MPEAINTRAALNLSAVLMIVTVLASVTGGTWTVSRWIAAQEARIDGLERRQETADKALADARATGKEAREAVARDSVQRHQLQQSEIDRLRQEQQSTAAFIAETRADMRALQAVLARIEARLFGPPDGRR